MDTVKATRVETGYLLTYKKQTTTIVRRPDLYFDLTLGSNPPVKGYLKDHKAAFAAFIDGAAGEAPAGAAPQAAEPSARRSSPVAGSPAQAPERATGPAFEPIGGKTPIDGNGVTADCCVIAFPPAREAVIAEPVKEVKVREAMTGSMVIWFMLHEGSDVRVTLGKNAALLLMAELRLLLQPGEE